MGKNLIKIKFLKDIKDINNRTYENCLICSYEFFYNDLEAKENKHYINLALQQYATTIHINFDRIEIEHSKIADLLYFGS